MHSSISKCTDPELGGKVGIHSSSRESPKTLCLEIWSNLDVRFMTTGDFVIELLILCMVSGIDFT